jgi:hypothetical protein
MANASDELRLAHHTTARVQSGSRVEVTVPGLEEGQDVDVFLIAKSTSLSEHISVLEFLDALPPGPRSAATWSEVEEQFQEGREGWGR